MTPALVLVDLQADYLDSSDLQPAPSVLVDRTAALVAAWRRRNLPIIHIWTTVDRAIDRRLPHWKREGRWSCVDGTAGHRTPHALTPHADEVVVHKTGFNGYAGGRLEAALVAAGCDVVVVAGLHLHTCVRAIATESLERQLGVLVADDATATNDPMLAAATRRWLAARGVEFLALADVLARIDGRGATGIVHRSPRETATILFEVEETPAPAVSAATATSAAAWRTWRHTELHERAAILERFADELESAASELATQMAVEIGKPVSHGGEETRRAAASVRDVVARAMAFAFQTSEPAGLVRHQPLGVIALISPWNNPVAIAVGKIAPALIYGNTVVWKPAPAATRISEAILTLARRAGVPRDVVQIVTGDRITAQALAADGAVDAVTLTSSASAGHAVQEICGRRFVPLQAELSGNNAAIVCEDADLEHAAAQIAWGAFGFAGQRCTANRRVVVPQSILETFLGELERASAGLAWGDPRDPATEIGPVIHTGKRDEHAWLVARAGRVVRPFGTRAAEPWTRAGAYAEPAIVVCDDEQDLLVQEETMSPLLVVQPAGSWEHALALCNGVRHGLVAALFSSSQPRQAAFLDEARAGMLKINTTTAGVDVSLPFGGWKQSGLGPPEHGEADRLFYTRMQAVYGAPRGT